MLKLFLAILIANFARNNDVRELIKAVKKLQEISNFILFY